MCQYDITQQRMQTNQPSSKVKHGLLSYYCVCRQRRSNTHRVVVTL